ncbi:MAG: flagellar protein FlgN [Lachnospiraceae bacterium]|nr:flagellar protein FlgN [Lachnospiraceae bacterium]
MASLIQNLEEILTRETTEYEGLIELSRQKTSVIVKGDIEALQKITDEEQITVAKINRIDAEREKAMKDVAAVLNMDVHELKLSDLLQVLERRPTERQKFAEVYDRLGKALREMKQVNNQNRQLIENALEMTRYELNMLQSMRSAPETANYGANAMSDGLIMGSTQGSFDAKQ